MLPSAISDQKRLVRGLHWQRARYFMRARDAVHHATWKILMIAGPVPHEEIRCIKELMPRAHITAVDISEKNVLAAIDAGADDAYCIDVGALEMIQYQYSKTLTMPKPFNGIRGDDRFDIICLDLTGPANEWLKKIIHVYLINGLKAKGVMIFTFSYGRDVVEHLSEVWRKARSDERELLDHPISHLRQIPEQLAARVYYVIRSYSRFLDSCLQYRGSRMPMISCLLVKKSNVPSANFACIEKTDYDLALQSEDLGNVFACPVERLVALRKQSARSTAAKKAVATRKARKIGKPALTLLEFQPTNRAGDK